MRAAVLLAAAFALVVASSDLFGEDGSGNCESAIQLIESAEGLELCEYKDTTGHPTICYGFNLDDSDAQSEIEKVGGNYQKVMAGGCLTQPQCVQLLTFAVNLAEGQENQIFGSICPCIDAVLTDMTYNLGQAGLESFTTFIGLIKARNFASAANDLKGTLWCKQVGTRCTRDTGIIAGGCHNSTMI